MDMLGAYSRELDEIVIKCKRLPEPGEVWAYKWDAEKGCEPNVKVIIHKVFPYGNVRTIEFLDMCGKVHEWHLGLFIYGYQPVGTRGWVYRGRS